MTDALLKFTIEKSIDDRFDEWHEGKGKPGQELYEYLGWTHGEYREYLVNGTIPAKELPVPGWDANGSPCF